jgi:hypothetical protein
MPMPCIGHANFCNLQAYQPSTLVRGLRSLLA